jgi:hypothetical protein
MVSRIDLANDFSVNGTHIADTEELEIRVRQDSIYGRAPGSNDWGFRVILSEHISPDRSQAE